MEIYNKDDDKLRHLNLFIELKLLLQKENFMLNQMVRFKWQNKGIKILSFFILELDGGG